MDLSRDLLHSANCWFWIQDRKRSSSHEQNRRRVECYSAICRSQPTVDGVDGSAEKNVSVMSSPNNLNSSNTLSRTDEVSFHLPSSPRGASTNLPLIGIGYVRTILCKVMADRMLGKSSFQIAPLPTRDEVGSYKSLNSRL